MLVVVAAMMKPTIISYRHYHVSFYCWVQLHSVRCLITKKTSFYNAKRQLQSRFHKVHYYAYKSRGALIVIFIVAIIVVIIVISTIILLPPSPLPPLPPYQGGDERKCSYKTKAQFFAIVLLSLVLFSLGNEARVQPLKKMTITFVQREVYLRRGLVDQTIRLSLGVFASFFWPYYFSFSFNYSFFFSLFSIYFVAFRLIKGGIRKNRCFIISYISLQMQPCVFNYPFGSKIM